VVVFSGEKLLVGQHVRLLDLRFGIRGAGEQSLRRVRSANADINGDSVPDVLAGSRRITPINFLGAASIAVRWPCSRAVTGARMAFLSGQNGDHLGDSLLAGVIDMNGDGHSGVRGRGFALRQLDDRLRRAEVTAHCSRARRARTATARPNSLGCAPSDELSGSASLSVERPRSRSDA